MLFNSLSFALFLPVVFGLHFLLPHRVRWVLLLVASYVFYMAWQPAYALLLLSSTTIDYAVGLLLGTERPDRQRRLILAISLLVNFGVLFVFKYYNLVNETFAAAAASLGIAWTAPRSTLLLPVGISFTTFQTVAYTIDVYRRKIPPERHFGMFALYVAYFPQLVAGPIERASHLLPQLRREVVLDWDRVASGFRLAAWGMFKKVVVADRLAEIANPVFDDPQSWSGPALTLGLFAFTWQVYCDFSGYSDIAVGVARMLGVDLMRNFDQPHGSRSMTEMWTRWHISLSTWFRDYVYIPLGGSRRGEARWALAVMVVFVTSGLWHGATWGFAMWGATHGTLLVAERFTAGPRARAAAALGLTRSPRLHAGLQILRTFVLWQISLVFFRAVDLSDTWFVLGHLGTGWDTLADPLVLAQLLLRLNLDLALLAYCALLVPLTELVDWARRQGAWRDRVAELPRAARYALDYAVIFAVLILGNHNDTAFVYFQF